MMSSCVELKVEFGRPNWKFLDFPFSFAGQVAWKIGSRVAASLTHDIAHEWYNGYIFFNIVFLFCLLIV